MTKCGVICTCVIIIIAMAALVICSVRGEKNRGAKRAAGGVGPYKKEVPGTPYEPGPLVFRRGGARYVTCQASTRLDDGYIVGLGGRSGADLARMTLYAKKELAAVLAEQALAAGGIRFYEEGGTLRAELRAMVGEEAAE
jgi:hypothetical protein